MTGQTAVEQAAPPHGNVFEINSGGTIKPFVYKADEEVVQVITQAVREFQLASQPHQLGLFAPGATQQLDPNQTLAQAGVHPGETLLLKPIVVQGG